MDAPIEEDLTHLPTGGLDTLLEEVMPRLQRVLMARYGGEVGIEVAADARAWACAHPERLLAASNPAGLLYRVAQSHARPHHRWLARRAPIEIVPEAVVARERPDLVDLYRSLGRLSDRQRIAVVLVHAHGESYRTAAELLGVSTAAVTNHVHRGLTRLRKMMEERDRC